VRGTWRGLGEKDEILFYQETLFIGEFKRFVKEGSGNGQSLYSGPIREPGGGSFSGNSNICAPVSWTQQMLRVCRSGGNLELQ
jgi:hypothetical protein